MHRHAVNLAALGEVRQGVILQESAHCRPVQQRLDVLHHLLCMQTGGYIKPASHDFTVSQIRWTEAYHALTRRSSSARQQSSEKAHRDKSAVLVDALCVAVPGEPKRDQSHLTASRAHAV